MKTLKAQFRTSENNFHSERIDEKNGVIYGVKIIQAGRMACFSGEDGKARRVMMTGKHADAFIKHANGQPIASHWTHGHEESEDDSLVSCVGMVKDFSKDADGSLIANFHVAPSEYRDRIFWNARNHATGMMFSPIFRYDASDPEVIPRNFEAADLVGRGAATVALFSEASDNENNNQTETVMDEEKVKEIAKAALSEHVEAQSKVDEANAAIIEKESGVTEADHNEAEDKELTAMMRAHKRIARAHKRQLTEVQANSVIEAKAQFTREMGNNGYSENNSGAGDSEPKTAKAKFSAKVKAYEADCGSYPKAYRRAASDFPELYNQAIGEK